MEEIILINKKRTILGVILVIILPFLCLLPYPHFFGYDVTLPEVRNATFWISRILLWLLVGGFVFYAYKVERMKFLPWTDIHYSPGIYLAFLVVTFVGLFFIMIAVSLVLRALHLHNDSTVWERIGQLLKGNIILTIFTCITAGVTEELLFRGYLQPRLELLFRNKIAAIIGSSFFFGLLHFGFGTVQNIVGPFVIGVVFSIHYSVFRNIKFLIVFHILWDLFAIFLLLNYYQK